MPNPVMQQDAIFRAAVNRLTLTPVEELPRIAALVATSLANCPLETLFSETKSNPSSVSVHKLRTRITTLLQDRSSAGRLTAAILIKTIIKGGGQDLLASSEPWARGLIGCLSKAEPDEIKILYLTTITKLFLLTQNQPALLREITTPLLPPFLSACLKLILPISLRSEQQQPSSVPSSLLDPVLRCWLRLLPHHASTFRPFLNRIKPVCFHSIGSCSTPTTTIHLCTKLLCSMVSCAPKNGASQEWIQMSKDLLECAHATATKLLRAVLEEHESSIPYHSATPRKHNFSKDPQTTEIDQLGLGPWRGISGGSSRFTALVTWLRHLISSTAGQSVPVPLGGILDLTTRILALQIIDGPAGHQSGLKFHNEASKEEKEELLLYLPDLHVSCLHLLWTLSTTYGDSLQPLYRVICDQVLDAFQVMSRYAGIRMLSYDIIGHIIRTSNLSDLGVSQRSFSEVALRCCNELKPIFPRIESDKAQGVSKQLMSTGDLMAVHKEFSIDTHLAADHTAISSAWNLLPVLAGPKTSPMITRQLRTEIDRIAIVLNHREAMLASVLNPMVADDGQATTVSILPFLTRSASDTIVTEAFLRPRFPHVKRPSALSMSTDSDPTIQSQVQESGEENDILSQLENSLNAMDKTMEVGDSTNGEIHEFESGVEEILSSRKRGFQDGPHTPTVEEMGAVARSPKRPRPDDELRTTLLKQDGVTLETTSASQSGVDVMTDISTLPSKLPDVSLTTEPSIPPSDSNNGAQYVDTDSSDSEIPQIDTGFDTDEEEEDVENE